MLASLVVDYDVGFHSPVTKLTKKEKQKKGDGSCQPSVFEEDNPIGECDHYNNPAKEAGLT